MKRVPLALLFLLSACVAPPPAMRPERTDRPARAVEAAAVRHDSTVRVRLSAQEKKELVRIGGTPLGTIIFEREGDGVRTSAGGFAESFTASPAPGGEGLSLGGRVYPGVLVVTPHRVRGLRVENRVDLETYVAGVVPAELVLWSALPAEIEAQAITARTYALCCLDPAGGCLDPAGGAAARCLWDDTRHQVYLGRFQSGDSAAASRVAARFESAMIRSAGIVLRERGRGLHEVRFHASCGGHTRAATTRARREGSGSIAVSCAPCAEAGARERTAPADDRSRRVSWSWTASEADLRQLARSLDIGDRVHSLRSEEVDPHGRWTSVRVEGNRSPTVVNVARLRAVLGPDRLRSGRILKTWPAEGENIARGLYFEGLGWGHGEGLCQVGSHEYAARGWSSTRILQHYFPEATPVALEAPLTAGLGR